MTIIVLLLAAGMFDRTTAIDKHWARERNRVSTGWHDTHPGLPRPLARIPRLVGSQRRYVGEAPATSKAVAAQREHPRPPSGVHARALEVRLP